MPKAPSRALTDNDSRHNSHTSTMTSQAATFPSCQNPFRLQIPHCLPLHGNPLCNFASESSITLLFLDSTHQPQPETATVKTSRIKSRITRSSAAMLCMQILEKPAGAMLSKPCHLQVQEVRVPASVLFVR